ncbi:MAG: pyridine nucleotide-disulfide oxidoreductase [Ectothiorhodospiraceae bacterium]|nr:pyridine nucleotide-disulfide oxidoreductase [Ectothiorhodospiraceae bacterium]
MKTRILILGGGFGGAYCAQQLEKRLRPQDADITLIDRNNYFNFYPLLVEAGTGSLEPRHTVVSIRQFLKRTTFIAGEVVDGDVQDRRIDYRVTGTDNIRSLDYDHLVIALGSVTSLPDVPGLKEHAFEMKTLTHAVSLRDRAIQLLERANATPDPEERKALLRFIVVGANFTGVEVAGEYEVFLKEASRMYENVRAKDCSVTLVEIMERILLALDEDLSEYARDQLERRGIDIRLEETVSEIGKDYVKLKSGDEIRTHTVVWCAGIAPNPVIEKLQLPTGKRGYITCERDMRVEGLENVWGIGDCSVNPDPDGNPYPPTAQHATKQAEFLAKNLRNVIQNKEPEPYVFNTRGELSPLGCRTAVAKVFGIKLSGFPAWFLWRTVYLSKMPGLGKKLRVALDWTMDLLFRKDYVQLGIRDG